MNGDQMREIANAVLYEGYLLYPYRHSAIKNRQRWTFGVVYPRDYSDAHGDTEPWTMRTECLVTGSPETTLDITVRFLHLLVRSSMGAASGETSDTHATAWAPDTWEEAVEREVSLTGRTLGELVANPETGAIAFPGAHLQEPAAVGRPETIVRDQHPIEGSMIVAAESVAAPDYDARVYKLSVRIENTTPVEAPAQLRHDAVLPRSFVSTHALLQVRGGAFVSLLDPPDALREVAAGCRNERAWPVLLGDEGVHDAMLSSPIILYDYPQIAPESPGALFDGTEIDEILTLRILTLTDDEKEEMRQSDERAREILERTEALSPEQLMKMHGVIRGLQGGAEERGGGEA